MVTGSDSEIMERVSQGEVGDLAILFERHSQKLLAFFMRITGSRASSEDLVQEVFMRMLRYRETFRGGEGGFNAWMFTLARNAHVDYLRRASRHDLPPLPDPEPPASLPSAEDLVGARQSADLLAVALSKLGPEKREVLILRRFHFKKFEEIAGILGCPVSTAKVRAHRALRELRSLYDSLLSEATT